MTVEERMQSTFAALDKFYAQPLEDRDYDKCAEILNFIADHAYAEGRADQRADDAKSIEHLATTIRIGL